MPPPIQKADGEMDSAPDSQTRLERRPLGWLGSIVAAALFGGMALISGALSALLVATEGYSTGGVLLALSAFLLLLSNYVWRDGRAKRGWRITIEPGELTLNLPAGRTLMSDAPAVHRAIEMTAVSAIETRLEGYRSFGLGSVHRSYALRLKSGELIVLGEDRALATDLADESVGRMVDVLATKTGLPMKDHGMVEGAGGLLGLLFASAPEWNTPDLAPARQSALWQRASFTGRVAGIMIVVAVILSAIG